MEQTGEATGETEDKKVVVSRVVPQPLRTVWDVLMTPDGAEALLGPGAVLGSKGHTWQSHDGRQGVIRSFHPLEQIRFSWRLKDAPTPSMVAVNLADGEQETRISIVHSNLSPGADLRWIEDRWNAALDRIESDCM